MNFHVVAFFFPYRKFAVFIYCNYTKFLSVFVYFCIAFGLDRGTAESEYYRVAMWARVLLQNIKYKK